MVHKKVARAVKKIVKKVVTVVKKAVKKPTITTRVSAPPRQPTVKVTTTPAQQLGGVKVTDISGGVSVKTVTKPGQASIRTVSRAPAPSRGGGITTRTISAPPISDVEAIRLVERAEAAQRAEQEARVAQQQASREKAFTGTVAGQLGAGITGATTLRKDIKKKEPRVRESEGRKLLTAVAKGELPPGTREFGTGRVLTAGERFKSNIKQRTLRLGTVFQLPFAKSQETGKTVLRTPFQPSAQLTLKRKTKELGASTFGPKGGVPLAADVLSAAFLRPLALPTGKKVATPGSELEARRKGLQQEFIRGATPKKLFGFGGIIGLGDPLTGQGTLGGGIQAAQIAGFKEARMLRREQEAAKKIQKRAVKQTEFLAPRAKELSELSQKSSILSQDIEVATAAGEPGFVTEEEAVKFRTRKSDIEKRRGKIVKEIRKGGITVKESEIGGGAKQLEFSSLDIRKSGQIGSASLKVLKEIPTKRGKALAVGGALASEAAQFFALGAAAKAVGVTGAIGKGIAAFGPTGQKIFTVASVGAIGGFTAVRGVRGTAEARRLDVPVSGAILSFGEPIAQIGGLIIGAQPSASPLQIKTIRGTTTVSKTGELQFIRPAPGAVDQGQVVIRSLVAKVPFVGPKGVFPLITKAQVGGVTLTKTVAGKGLVATGTKATIFKTTLGVPKGAIITPTGEFTPSGAIETKLFLKTLKNIPPAQAALIKSQFKLVTLTSKATGRQVFKQDVFKSSKGFQKLSPAQQKIARDFLSRSSGGSILKKGKVFGSAASDVQLDQGLGREVKDIDFQFGFKAAEPQAKTLVGLLNKVAGAKVSLAPGATGQITIGKGKAAVKVFDLHGIDNFQDKIQAVENPFGFTERGTVRVGRTNINKLTQEGINKLASTTSLSKTGAVPGTTKSRIKDVGDFFRIQQALVGRLSSAKSVKATALLAESKKLAIAKFGSQAFAPQQKQFLDISSLSPGVSPGLSVVTAVKIPSLSIPGVKTKILPPSVASTPGSLSPSIPVSPSASSSIGSVSSVSPVRSTSFSPSPSPSPSISVSPSVSPSISPSPSISVSPSPSPSPSISLSPSISPSLSPSPSASSVTSLAQPVPPFAGGFPFLFPPLTFKRPLPKKRKKVKPRIRFIPSITGAVLNIRLGATPKELSVGGFSPFRIRGIPKKLKFPRIFLAPLKRKKKKKKK